MLLHAAASCLIVVDVQTRLVAAVSEAPRVIANARLLLDAAAHLDVPVLATEQYPEGLGATVPALADALAPSARFPKITFAAAADAAFVERLRALKRPQVVLLGMEAHVCVLQSALGLLREGMTVYVVADAVASRDPADARAAVDRLVRAGAHIVTAEMVVFEWLERADTPAFRALLPALKARTGRTR
ncbi:MAG: isochorismatase family protein [Alphaproteobacteria bacterium]|nr:MAG: isochorismatase family protein [Alphaproteobacteria bacterium]